MEPATESPIVPAEKEDVLPPQAEEVQDARDGKQNAHNAAGLAVMQQQELIPTTGERKTTTKWEYWTYCVFCESTSWPQ